jgi:hypothetical protein
MVTGGLSKVLPGVILFLAKQIVINFHILYRILLLKIPLVPPLIAKSTLRNGYHKADSTTPRPDGPVARLVYALDSRRASREAAVSVSDTRYFGRRRYDQP